MELTTFFAYIFIFTFSIFAALMLFAKLIWPNLESFILRLNALNRNKALDQESRQLTYAAYERLILFTQRIEPYQLMLRHHQPNVSISIFKTTLIQEIENEYLHNFTQQLYVSKVAWHTIVELKNNTIALLKNSAAGLPAQAAVDQYIELILKHLKDLDPNPYTDAQQILKKELAI